MELVKNLETAAKAFLSDLKTMDSRISATQGSLDVLNAKKTALQAEVSELEAKKAAVGERVGSMEKEAQVRIDNRLQELKTKEDQVLADRAELKTRLFQAETAKQASEDESKRYSLLYAEYTQKKSELDAKLDAILAAAK